MERVASREPCARARVCVCVCAAVSGRSFTRTDFRLTHCLFFDLPGAHPSSGKGGSNTGKHKGLTDEQDEWVTTAQVHVRGGGGNDRRDRGGGRDRRREPESSGSGFSDDDRDGRGGRGGRDGARGDARGSGRGGRDRDTGDDAGSTPTGPSRVKPERGGSTAGGRTGGTGRGASATPTTARAGPTTARTTQYACAVCVFVRVRVCVVLARCVCVPCGVGALCCRFRLHGRVDATTIPINEKNLTPQNRPRKVPTPPAPPEDNSSKLALYSMMYAAVDIVSCQGGGGLIDWCCCRSSPSVFIVDPSPSLPYPFLPASAVLIFGCVCYGPFIILGFVAAGAGENINANATGEKPWMGGYSTPRTSTNTHFHV